MRNKRLKLKILLPIMTMFLCIPSTYAGGSDAEMVEKLTSKTSYGLAINPDNYKYDLFPGEVAKVEDIEYFPNSGNCGIKIKITQGTFKDQVFWLHQNPKSPRLFRNRGNEITSTNPCGLLIDDEVKLRYKTSAYINFSDYKVERTYRNIVKLIRDVPRGSFAPTLKSNCIEQLGESQAELKHHIPKYYNIGKVIYKDGVPLNLEKKAPVISYNSSANTTNATKRLVFNDPPPPLSPAVLAIFSEAKKFVDEGNKRAAIETYERANRIDPRNPEIMYKIAQTYWRMNWNEESSLRAEELTKKAISLATNLSIKIEMYNFLALIYEHQENFEEAEKSRNKVDELSRKRLEMMLQQNSL